MPTSYYVIEDTVTGLYLTRYSTNLAFCNWGNLGDAVHFSTQKQCDDTIDTWGDTSGRYIGKNPNPR